MSTPFVGEIIVFAGNFAIVNYAFCNGALLPIGSYDALFSIVGTLYGGDGRSTFGLPDLTGRMGRHANPGGAGGLPATPQGAKRGSTTASLQVGNLPPHQHSIKAPVSNVAADQVSPIGNFYAVTQTNIYNAQSPTPMLQGNTDAFGTGNPFEVQNPFLAINYLIALNGIYPSRA